MATIHNEIMIDAPASKVWAVLADLEALDRYDPIVHKSVALTETKTGLGARRRCETGGGWFEEEVTTWNPGKELEFSILQCSQPMKDLTHTYSLDEKGGRTRVRQVMRYTMKFGVLGSIMDAVIGKRTADKQIKLFFVGLKQIVETGKGKERWST